MNRPRLWLLILLCALIPLRGAMAAAMLCPPANGGAASVQMLVLAQAPEGHAHDDGSSTQAHGHAHAEASQAGHDHADPASAQDKCNLCAAFCSLTPAPIGQPVVLPPAGAAAAPSSFFSVQPPSFVPGGLERPPRSI